MPTSALVLTLDDIPTERQHAQRTLESVRGLCLGESFGQRLAAVLETSSLSQSRRVVERLQRTRGVQFVDVVGVNFEDAEL